MLIRDVASSSKVMSKLASSFVSAKAPSASGAAPDAGTAGARRDLFEAPRRTASPETQGAKALWPWPPPPPGPKETVINKKLYDYLKANPRIQTSQDLINATYKQGKFESTCKELGLNSAEISKYRSAKLIDYAVIRQAPAGTPRTTQEANKYHLTQYNTSKYGTDYNRYFDKTGDFSNNCGPASLAMSLRSLGKMPAGLNPEQQIDYTRALISGTSNKQVTVNGKTYKLYDKDLGPGSLVGNGQIAGGATALGVPASRQSGWGSLNDAMAAGKPVVAAGFISQDWKAQFPASGHYGSAGRVGHFIAILGKTNDGKYLVSDPMYANGSVAMTAAQLEKFTGTNPDFTAIGKGK